MRRKDGSDRPVVVGYDNRFISDRAAIWLAEVFAAHGIKVLKFDRPMPTPAIMYAVKDMGLAYGAMVTASHNPYYFNGVKLFNERRHGRGSRLYRTGWSGRWKR